MVIDRKAHLKWGKWPANIFPEYEMIIYLASLLTVLFFLLELRRKRTFVLCLDENA